MKESKYTQMVAVTGIDPQDTADKFNKTMKSLADKRPTYQMVEPTIFYVFYTEYEHTAETLADEYENAGCEAHCESCPHFCHFTTKTGKPDLRSKKGMCDKCGHWVYKASAACDVYYGEINAKVFRKEA